MADRNTEDGRLHVGLSEVGAEIPEPRAPAGVRARIESMACGAEAPAAGASWRARIGPWLVGAVAASLAVVSGVLFVENERLRDDLSRARSGGGGVVHAAAQEQAPLMMVSFFHEECPTAGRVAPRFEEMASRYGDRPVLFVTLDVSEGCESQAGLLSRSLGLESVFHETPTPAKSGTVALVDTRTREVVASCSGVEQLPEIERALVEAVKTCGGEACPPE